MIRFYINTACAVRHRIIFTAPFKVAARIFGDLALNALNTKQQSVYAPFKSQKQQTIFLNVEK